jgi:putative oxidoreductase
MKTKIFGVRNYTVAVDIAILLLRLVCGFALMYHGYGKIQHPLTWMGEKSTYPGFFQALSAIAEFVGGGALVLGFLTRIAAFGIICNFIVAVHLHAFTMHNPFVSNTGGPSYELALIYLIVGVLMLVAGPARFSVDRLIFGND